MNVTQRLGDNQVLYNSQEVRRVFHLTDTWRTHSGCLNLEESDWWGSISEEGKKNEGVFSKDSSLLLR